MKKPARTAPRRPPAALRPARTAQPRIPAHDGDGHGEEYAAARVRLLRNPGLPGPERRRALAALTDRWLAGLFATAAPPAGTALVAVGGYGHGTLCPRSDLDLLLLHDEGVPAGEVAALADRLWYPVWDLGLALDHSVRTPAQSRRAAAHDLKVQLGLLDARHVAGEKELTTALRAAALTQWRSDAATRLPGLRELAAARARRHGDLRYLVEPDLKEARGGLRDLTALRAVAASWLADAPRDGLREAQDALLDIRDALHLTTGRATDRLCLQDQHQVAEALGLPDADALLRHACRSAAVVTHAADVTWREVERVLRPRAVARRAVRLHSLLHAGRPAAGAAPERTPLADGVVAHDGEAALAEGARPDRDPVLPLRAAAAAARAALPLAPAAVRRLARTAPDLPTPWPAQAREHFVALLGAGAAAVPVWEALDAAGLITRLLPEWDHVRCRPQRDPVHRWTVDRHLLECAVRAAALTRRVHRPDLLLTAALLHDIGKGRPGDHADAGVALVRGLAPRLGFDDADTRTLALLVRHHLLLVRTATRRDITDPATLHTVAEAVRSRGTLALLHALTEADALATGPAAWSPWRASLVATLVARVDAVLAGEAVTADPHEGVLGAEDEQLVGEVRRTGRPVLRTADAPGGRGLATWGDADSSGTAGGRGALGAPDSCDLSGADCSSGVELRIALPDRPGALSAVAGLLALHRLTVHAARLRQVPAPPVTADGGAGPATGVLLLTWQVAAHFGTVPGTERLRADLVRVLGGSLDLAARLGAGQEAHRGAAFSPPPRVSVVPTASRTATVVEVRAQDARGLLYRVSRVLDEAGVRVRSAHIGTLGGNAVDAFYLTDPHGAPLPEATAARLVRRLEAALC
ncbi:[protein-PII] uridylyltransferase [Streptomyces albus]|uniref:[protein-PII] uridylyltransferase n=1 Tax=Streptomyces sp. NRRL F-5639 TaxID=1463867 RepID=UPI0004C5250A